MNGITIAAIIAGYLVASVIVALAAGRFIAAGNRRADDL